MLYEVITELASELTGLPVTVVDEQGAPCGKKDVLMMKGLEGAAQTAITLIHAAVYRNLATIVYTQSRKITELIAVWAGQRAKSMADKICAYRAGFLPEERREIEQKLAKGELLCVVSTSARITSYNVCYTKLLRWVVKFCSITAAAFLNPSSVSPLIIV